MLLRRTVTRFACLLALVGAVLCASPVAAAPILYGVTAGNKLITVDPLTGAAALVGTFATSTTPLGLAAKGSNLYIYGTGDNLLHQIDPATAAYVGAAISLGFAPGSTSEGDLAFRTDGTGFLASNPLAGGALYSFNTAVPGTATPIASGGNRPKLDGLAFNAANGQLYGLQQNPNTVSFPGPVTTVNYADLYIVNQGTGALTIVGSTGIPNVAFGALTFGFDGTLYAVGTNQADLTSRFYSVNTTTGLASLIGLINFDRVDGLAFLDAAGPDPNPNPTPVPEPATILLLGSGLAGVLSRHRARVRSTRQ
jgi:hypothetical protein